MENFHFKGFAPSESLQIKADRALDNIIEHAPSGATITATVEQDGEIYHCSIEIGSASCPFVVETSHKFASIAVDKAELNIMRKLDKWRGSKFVSEDRAPIRAPLRIAT